MPSNNLRLSLWAWRDAPPEYKKLSTHGGDEDWVMHVPAEMRPSIPWTFESVVESSPPRDGRDYLEGFGWVDRHELANGDVLVIFAHA